MGSGCGLSYFVEATVTGDRIDFRYHGGDAKGDCPDPAAVLMAALDSYVKSVKRPGGPVDGDTVRVYRSRVRRQPWSRRVLTCSCRRR